MQALNWNEGFLIMSGILSLLVAIPISRKMNLIVVILIWLACLVYTETVDYILAADFDLYDFLNNPYYEPALAITHFIIYPSAGIVMLYFYLKINHRKRYVLIYFIGWTAFSVFFEWINVVNGVITYKGWKLIYSVPTYPITMFLEIQFYNLVILLLKKDQPERWKLVKSKEG